MIKFKVQASEFTKALNIISIVTPKPVTSQGNAGYLFVIRANGTCQAYSQESKHVTRAEIPISEVEGEGAFVYPSAFVGGFKELDGSDLISFEVGDREGSFYIRYETSSGASGERPTFDPQKHKAVEVPEAGETDAVIPAALLRKAFDTVKGAIAKEDGKSEEFYQGIQIFDASKPEWETGDGHMFAADGIRAAYFYCEAFKGKGLVIHGLHLGYVGSFLAKCDGDVILRTTDNWSFMIHNGGALGWTHHAKTHPRFKYYGEEMEKHVLLMNRDFLLRTLRYMRASLDVKADKVRIAYEATPDAWSLRFFFKETTGMVTSPLVTVMPGSEEAKVTGFSFNVNIDHFSELIEAMEAKQVGLRVAIFPPKGNRKEQALFRTIDRFWLDAGGKVLPGPEKGIECRVTRFVPSKD